MYVYFMQRGDDRGPIKIGYAKDVWARQRDLQVACAEELKVVAMLYVGERAPLIELDLHEWFQRYRMRGEWFKPGSRLRRLIRQINSDNYKEVGRAINKYF